MGWGKLYDDGDIQMTDCCCACVDQISDVDNIMGVVNTEPIQVIAEAYDVALDMSFPKGMYMYTLSKSETEWGQEHSCRINTQGS